MSDIVAELRERALRAEQDGEPIALLDEAAGEIEKLRSWVRIQDAVIRSGNVATLTEAERQVLEWAIEVSDSLADCGATGTGGEESHESATLRGLLERLK